MNIRKRYLVTLFKNEALITKRYIIDSDNIETLFSELSYYMETDQLNCKEYEIQSIINIDV